MAKHFHGILTLALGWLSATFLGDWFVDGSRLVRRLADYVVKATASVRAVTPVAEWRLIERLCSRAVREKLNTFGRDPRSTGALSAPCLN